MLMKTRSEAEDATKAGKKLYQLKQEKIIELWKKWSGDFISSDAFIETLYNDLTGRKNGEFIKRN